LIFIGRAVKASGFKQLVVNGPGNFVDKIVSAVEIMYGTLSIFGEEWYGEYGSNIKSLIQSSFGTLIENLCYSFDVVMLGINTLDFRSIEAIFMKTLTCSFKI
jgi:hypothetical protein